MGQEKKRLAVHLNSGLTGGEFEKVLNPYADNDLDGFSPERAGKSTIAFIDRNEEIIKDGLKLLSKSSACSK